MRESKTGVYYKLFGLFSFGIYFLRSDLKFTPAINS